METIQQTLDQNNFFIQQHESSTNTLKTRVDQIDSKQRLLPPSLYGPSRGQNRSNNDHLNDSYDTLFNTSTVFNNDTSSFNIPSTQSPNGRQHASIDRRPNKQGGKKPPIVNKGRKTYHAVLGGSLIKWVDKRQLQSKNKIIDIRTIRGITIEEMTEKVWDYEFDDELNDCKSAIVVVGTVNLDMNPQNTYLKKQNI
ncbi:unnamed protein product [Didymodactylos carnosus]|uniref:Uncharacterized protein n=1 Tax=Didymodactylos carnosus TaxID=1234261 RepID=A0A815V272_9BILA|nr:unnamed protein product [Didymodactylos carnosus]CAF1530367.1 unnamed protein product [Didymodactylos carnosus]CAF4148722.1 unnamed protein product [Didymodactylos carnosus]CAF4389584.1 unnamed protein product [Didymodactylos carnosus]